MGHARCLRRHASRRVRESVGGVGRVWAYAVRGSLRLPVQAVMAHVHRGDEDKVLRIAHRGSAKSSMHTAGRAWVVP
jgi:hypothetical protein